MPTANQARLPLMLKQINWEKGEGEQNQLRNGRVAPSLHPTEYVFECRILLLGNDSFVDKLFERGPNRRIDDYLGQQNQRKRQKQPAISRKIKQQRNGDFVADGEPFFYGEKKQW